MKAIVAAALLGTGASALAQACEPGLAGDDVARVESDRYVLAYRIEPAPVAVGAHFALDLAVCGKNGAPAPDTVRVDAHMPAHRHGMNYTPEIRRAAPGRWHAEGLLFHMPGDWEFRFDLRAAGTGERLTHGYRLN